ncbi:hypothetical protein [Pseudooceanicola sp. MF1-13]|uniref:hypothetical protein n=1 Tax=Pseudooceanicola sp. MF1-13 TaxID=3379095 RepID=UPI003892C8D3
MSSFFNWADMFDGGGPGRSGNRYTGGPIARFGNNILDEMNFQSSWSGKQNGHSRPTGYTSFADMFDGGGPGASGGRFRGGGMMSVMGNLLGGAGQPEMQHAKPSAPLPAVEKNPTRAIAEALLRNRNRTPGLW